MGQDCQKLIACLPNIYRISLACQKRSSSHTYPTNVSTPAYHRPVCSTVIKLPNTGSLLSEKMSYIGVKALKPNSKHLMYFVKSWTLDEHTNSYSNVTYRIFCFVVTLFPGGISFHGTHTFSYFEAHKLMCQAVIFLLLVGKKRDCSKELFLF